jgi:hypothetical protein
MRVIDEHGPREVRNVVFYLIAAVAAVIAVWMLAVSTWPESPAERARSAPGEGKPTKEPGGRPESLEGVLVVQLVAGEITPGQYRRAVERIAARDDERHPMALPPETGPADA